MTISKRLLMLTVCSLALSAAAYAQQQPDASVAPGAVATNGRLPAPQDDATATAPSDSLGAQDTGSTEIVVTARRRAESLQDVPISITALSGQALAARGVRDVLDLQYQTPSLSVTTNGPNRASVSFAIRGQRTNEAQLLTDPPVGAYFAEVVQPRPFGFSNTFFDLQNVQVLKGVQGTLFGRNMTGGAVLVEPNHPDMGAFHAEWVAQYGNYDTKDVYGMVNIPLIPDVLAFRIAGKYRDRDGFTKDISTGRDYDDQHYYALRPSLELRIDRFTNYVVFDYLKQSENGTALKLVDYALADPINGRPTVIGQQVGAFASGFFPVAAGAAPQNVVGLLNGNLALGRRRVDYGGIGTSPLDGNPGLPFLRVKNWGITNKTTFEAGPVTFKNIFGYRKVNYNVRSDFDGSAVALINPNQLSRTKDVSEEFQMQGKPFGSRFDLTLGAYYFRESGQDGSVQSTFPQITSIGFAQRFLATNPAVAGYFLNLPASAYNLTNIGRGVARSYAFYAAGTYTLTDQFKVSGGIRYNDDLRRATVNPFYATLAFPGGTPGICAYNGAGTLPLAQCAQSRELKNSAVTWDATLQYEPSTDLTGYVSARQGYRAGGFSLRAQSDITFAPFQPEKVREYEAGLKNRFEFGSGARLNTIIAAFFQDYTNVQRQNAISGPNGSVQTVVTNIAAQHDYGGEFEASLSLPNGISANLFYSYVKNEVRRGDNGSFVMQGVPHHQLGGGLSYARDLGEFGRLAGNVNATYRSSVPLDDFDIAAIQKGYALVNARVGVTDIQGTGVGVAVFANNITNRYYKIGTLSLISNGPVLNGVNPGGGAGFSAASFGDPRTYGVELSFKF